MKEISTKIISDVIKNFNIEKLIKYLKKKDLKLKKSHFKNFMKGRNYQLLFSQIN